MNSKPAIAFISFLFVVGCEGVKEADIEVVLEEWLQIDMPSDYNILNQSCASAPTGDDGCTVEFSISKQQYVVFLNQIDLSEWNQVQHGYQLVLHKPSEHNSLGYRYFHLSIEPEKNTFFRLQYGYE